MRADELWGALRREPFVPMRLCLSDGHRYEVYHPHMVVMSGRSLAIGVRSLPGVGMADHVVFCSLQHVVRVELI